MKHYTTYTEDGKTYLRPGDILLLDNILPDGMVLNEDEIKFKSQFFGIISQDWIDAPYRTIKDAMMIGRDTRQVAKLKPKMKTESTDKVSWTPPTGTIVNGYVPQEKYDTLVEQFNRLNDIQSRDNFIYWIGEKHPYQDEIDKISNTPEGLKLVERNNKIFGCQKNTYYI